MSGVRDVENYRCPECARKVLVRSQSGPVVPPPPASANGGQGAGPSSRLSSVSRESSTLAQTEQELHLIDLELQQQVELERVALEKRILDIRENSLKQKAVVLDKARSKVSGGSVTEKRLSDWVTKQREDGHQPDLRDEWYDTIQHEAVAGKSAQRATGATPKVANIPLPTFHEEFAPRDAQPQLVQRGIRREDQTGNLGQARVNPPPAQQRVDDTLATMFAERASYSAGQPNRSLPPGLLTSLHMSTEKPADVTAMVAEASTRELERLVTDSAELRARRQERAKETTKFPVLPPFSGDPLAWPGFLTSLVESTQNHGIPQEANASRLRLAITGTALELVKDLINVNSAVPLVLRYLRRQYGNAATVLSAMEAECIRQPPVDEDLGNLLPFMAKIEALCMMAKAYGQPLRYQGSALAEQMFEKLPSHIRVLRAIGSQQREEMNLEQLLKFLDPIAETAIPAIPGKATNRAVKRVLAVNVVDDDGDSLAHPPAVSSGSDMATGARTQSRIAAEPRCLADCNVAHHLTMCPTFLQMNPNERLNLTRQRRVCWACLSCHRRRCGVHERCQCGVNHHPLLHDALSGPNANRVQFQQS